MRALLYTTNAGVTPDDGTAVALGGIVRKYGSCVSVSGSSISITKPGYYNVDLSATFTDAATNTVSFTLQQDGINVSGATGSATVGTASTEAHNVAFGSVVRVFCCKPSTLQIIVDGAPTISNLAVRVEGL